MPDVFVGVHPLKNPVTTVEAGVAAFAAANRATNRHIRWNTQAGLERLRRGRTVFLFAMRAQDTHETLREHRFQRRGDKIRLDPHVHEAGQCPGGVIRVQCREYEVAGQGRLHGDLGRLLIANFADEDDIGIVTEYRTQAAGKGQTRFFRNLDLVNALELIFNGVFDGDDFAQGIIDFIQRGVQRRGFAASGRTRDENDSMR